MSTRTSIVLQRKGLSALKTHKRLLGSALLCTVALTGLARRLVRVNAPPAAVSRLTSGGALRVDAHKNLVRHFGFTSGEMPLNMP